MWIQTRAPVALALGGDGVVEVAGGGRVDGEGRQLGQVAARRRRSRSAASAAARRPRARARPRKPRQPSSLARAAPRPRRGRSAGSRAACARRRRRRGRGRARARPAPRLRGAAQPAPHLRPAERRRATFALSRLVGRASPGRRRPCTSGWMPWLRARLTPFGVKYSPTVSFSAPPLERLVLLLEDALAVGAGADHGRVAVVGQRRGEDLRRARRCCGRSGRPAAASAGCRRRSCGRCRPGCAIWS